MLNSTCPDPITLPCPQTQDSGQLSTSHNGLLDKLPDCPSSTHNRSPSAMRSRSHHESLRDNDLQCAAWNNSIGFPDGVIQEDPDFCVLHPRPDELDAIPLFLPADRRSPTQGRRAARRRDLPGD